MLSGRVCVCVPSRISDTHTEGCLWTSSAFQQESFCGFNLVLKEILMRTTKASCRLNLLFDLDTSIL